MADFHCCIKHCAIFAILIYEQQHYKVFVTITLVTAMTKIMYLTAITIILNNIYSCIHHTSHIYVKAQIYCRTTSISSTH